ncbi:MAG: hypothetical protein A3D96_00740 [Chlamydiae bacterium RIFCSPHIGHO2_12_FULL_44_59]|nr:MAG: hypothetical protein A2796_00185 [Chlamydiae bacterium RIFCSPHIGHO2_01_FULL_44_39]OGN58460.1 MAG: hypothetical protein A3C42_03360 [Chlamydiae bacterium RIFCSPHIGHO2_02_FULL_45_9]OGN59974.1 MAG: hypothetical protein A3D96_00740 [Chlamydiae bacterium RIFCSPHIGHO2_12_FULL_44_59]OGN66189.1 MAG: hypothetical protein A2978_06065 [Chlamydiae bacterium RIFCSPLOWO2_01_FULL_44_52]OGN69093.1 MAG: hypothetical protein A3I67_07550 [Chlamydiae bacterium RIFCSPLOWO2_02_FULL_45_22]OGN69885.1 MAG: hyp
MLRNRWLQFGQRLIELRLSWVFAPFSFLYALAVFFRNFLYDCSLLKITKVTPVVVSIGNVVAGGTRKTPFTLALARALSHRSVAILSRGYGRMPDEAILLARRLPQARICVGKDRVELARTIQDVDLILLDDGFQHRKLHRDIDVLLTRKQPDHYLPWGFLRDSPNRKADFVFVPDSDFTLVVKRILDLSFQEIPTIQGWKVDIFSAIADAGQFKKTVESLGAEIIRTRNYFDHEIPDLQEFSHVRPILCTEKDVVKLPTTDLPIYYLEMEVQIAASPKKWEMLIEKIEETIDNRRTL